MLKLGFDIPLPQQSEDDKSLWSEDGDEVDRTADSSLITANYRIVEKLGEGGCGIVYRAEQLSPVHRQVALKVIKLGMDTKAVIARFEAERQVLALLNHPNIAKVYDAGATVAGRPYFVMELVTGVKITEYCDRHKLSLQKRLALFLQVCQAVQHAHQKGIIHRDIKPSNILVSDEECAPACRIIDFGIAKSTVNQQLADETVFTALEQFVGTPAYMSPEQAGFHGSDIDTRSDIYSLGVLLYELLSGKVPFDPIRRGLEEIRRVITEEDPIRPSTRLSTLKQGEQTTLANLRSSSPPKLINLIRGDLDWVVMRCLEKDRVRRYGTATGLIEDILRHINGEPVSARPPSSLYRFRKLILRHKVSFLVGVALSITIMATSAISFWMYVREARAHKEAVVAETASRTEADQLIQVIKLLMTRGETNDFNVSPAAELLRQALHAQQKFLGGDLAESNAAMRQLQLTLQKGNEPVAEARFADGRIIEISAVTFGTNHHMGARSPLDSITPWLPDELRHLVTPKPSYAEWNSGFPSLVVWITAIDSATGNYVDCQDIHVEILGTDGQVSCGHKVSVGVGGYVANDFDWFPRADKMLRLRMSSAKIEAGVQLQVPNPHVVIPGFWLGRPLPVHEVVGSFDVVLTGLTLRTNEETCGNLTRFWQPNFELRKGNETVTGWDRPYWFAEDPMGNKGQMPPMTESVIRFSATFYPNATNMQDAVLIGSSPSVNTAECNSNTLWNLNLKYDNSSLLVLGLFAAGRHVFLDGVYQTNFPAFMNDSHWSPGQWRSSSETIAPRLQKHWFGYHAKVPVIFVSSPRSETESELGIRLKDDQGRCWLGRPAGTYENTSALLGLTPEVKREAGISVFLVDLPPEVKSVVAELVLLRPIKAEFLVQTPRP